MIFTTKNKEFAIFGNTITDVKEKWKEFKKELAKNDGKLFGENGALASLFGGKKSNILTPEILKQFDEFKEKFNSSSLSAEALAEQMENVDQRIIDYAKTCKNGEMTTEGFKASIDTMSFSAKAGKVALQALAMAGNMIAMWAISAIISKVVKTIDELVNSEENLRQSASDLGSELSNNSSDIEGYKKKIEELKAVINDSSSSFDEVSQARVDLMAIQDELIEKFGTEKGVIESITSAINDQTDALDELSRRDYFQKKNEFNEKNNGDKVADWLSFGNTSDDRIQSNMDKMVSSMRYSFYELETTGNEVLDNLIAKSYGLNIVEDMYGDGKHFQIYGALDEIQDKLYGIQELSQDFDLSTGFENSFTKISNDVDDALTKFKNLYDQYVLYEKILTDNPDNQYDEQFDLINKAKEAYNEAVKSGNEENIKTSADEYAKTLQSAIDLAMGNYDYDVADYFKAMYPELQQMFGEWQFSLNFEQNTDGLQDKVADALDSIDGVSDGTTSFSVEDIENFNPNVATQEQIDAYGELTNVAETYGLTVKQLIALLQTMGLIQSESYQQLVDTFGQDNVDKLSPEDLEIAYKIENVGNMTFEQLQTEIEKVKDSTNENPISLSLPDAQKLVNGLKGGETETLGLIDELSLLQEILSDTGNIQQETYAKLLSCSSKYSVAIRTENGRIALNTTKLKQVAKARQLDTQETIKQTIALMKQEWLQWANNIENYNGTLLESITSKYNDIDALQNEITQYELLANSVNEASNAFENFKTAQSTNDQDMYDTAQEAFNILKEYTSDTESKNYGKYNTDEFQEAVMLLMDTDTYRKAINAKDLEEYQKVINSFVKTLDPLFDEKNYNSAANLFNRIEEIMNSGNIPEADKDWAKRLGISEETFHALSQLGNLYDFNGKEIFEGYQLNTLDNYYEKLQAVKSAKDALNEIEDKDTNAYIRQEAELKNLTESYDTFVNDTVQKVSDAYTAFQQSSTGKSFADYLKETLDFDDTDITGSLMTVIDKSGDLQKTLDSISLNEVVQSQQEEYQQLQNLNQIISTLNENGYSSVDVEVKNKSGFDEVYNEYEKLRQKALEYQEAISNSDNPHEINELNGYLSECVSNMDKLREPLRLEIEANIERVNAQLESVKSKINELNNQTSLSPYQQERLGVLKGEQAALENQQATLEAQLKVIVDDSEVKDWKAPDDKKMTVTTQIDDSAVTSWTAPEKTMKVRAVVDTSGLTGSLGGLQSGSGTPGTSNTGGASQGGSHAKGTVGNAFANGYNGLPTDEKNALRSEYGQKEMTVYPDGRYEITETPTLSDLPKGTVIFNEKQTNRILKGISHFKGTVGRAFNTGTKINLPNLVDVISNNNAISDANNNSSKPSTTSDSPSHAAREAKEATEEIFDWIERRIKKFQAAFDKWVKQAETAVTSGFINKYYKKATSAIKNELSTYGKAYKRYMKQADSVGLSKKYRDKVKNGTIDIETIKDEKLAEQIKKYQEWCVTYAPLSGNRWRYSI